MAEHTIRLSDLSMQATDKCYWLEQATKEDLFQKMQFTKLQSVHMFFGSAVVLSAWFDLLKYFSGSACRM